MINFFIVIFKYYLIKNFYYIKIKYNKSLLLMLILVNQILIIQLKNKKLFNIKLKKKKIFNKIIFLYCKKKKVILEFKMEVLIIFNNIKN